VPIAVQSVQRPISERACSGAVPPPFAERDRAPIPRDKQIHPALKTKAQAYVVSYNNIMQKQRSSPEAARRNYESLNANLREYSQNSAIDYSDHLLEDFNTRMASPDSPRDSIPLMDMDTANGYDDSIASKYLSGELTSQQAGQQHGRVTEARVKMTRAQHNDINARLDDGRIDQAAADRLIQGLAKSVKGGFVRLSSLLAATNQRIVLNDVNSMLRLQQPQGMPRQMRPPFGTEFRRHPQIAPPSRPARRYH
jgi:hypothetical protein